MGNLGAIHSAKLGPLNGVDLRNIFGLAQAPLKLRQFPRLKPNSKP